MSLGSLYERGKAGVKTWTDRAADFLEAGSVEEPDKRDDHRNDKEEEP